MTGSWADETGLRERPLSSRSFWEARSRARHPCHAWHSQEEEEPMLNPEDYRITPETVDGGDVDLESGAVLDVNGRRITEIGIQSIAISRAAGRYRRRWGRSGLGSFRGPEPILQRAERRAAAEQVSLSVPARAGQTGRGQRPLSLPTRMYEKGSLEGYVSRTIVAREGRSETMTERPADVDDPAPPRRRGTALSSPGQASPSHRPPRSRCGTVCPSTPAVGQNGSQW